VLNTAVGTSYLAFSPVATRRAILNMLSKSGARGASGKERKVLNRRLAETARRGYAVRAGGTVPNTTSVAVPLLDRRYAVGAIVVSFLSSALSVEEAAAAFVGPLRDAAGEIAESLRASAGAPAARPSGRPIAGDLSVRRTSRK
jgi:IclR family mhp operon transcriptional activator